MGRARGAYGLGGHDEKEQTLNQLLVEMDGFDTSQGLILLAATNRPEILDPALLRAGRFDRQVLVDRPDKLGRVQILRVHVRKVQLAPDADLEKVAALTPGFTGADLANLVNEAAIFAVRDGREVIEAVDFSEARDRILLGRRDSTNALLPDERRAAGFAKRFDSFLPRHDRRTPSDVEPELFAVGSTRIRAESERVGATLVRLLRHHVAEALTADRHRRHGRRVIGRVHGREVHR